MVETFEHLNSKQVYLELEKASREWKDWQGKTIVLDEGKKAVFSKCFAISTVYIVMFSLLVFYFYLLLSA
jgi:hypothetical protein